MSKKKWFFKRGNARVSWDNAPKWAKWFAVDFCGSGFFYGKKPSRSSNHYSADSVCGKACHVGRECPDWRDLLFERATERCANQFVDNTQKPLITAEEWKAIRMILPGARYVAKDYGGVVYAYTKDVYATLGSWINDFLYENGCSTMPFLMRRFADVPWKESKIEYEGNDD